MSNCPSHFWRSRHNWLPMLLGLCGMVGLYAASQYNFLLFHSLAEAFSIIIAIAVFVIFWNTRQLLPNGFYLVVGLGCLFAGLFDLIYILAYPGMSLFPHADGNLALQAKTLAQWYVSLSCVGAFVFLHRMVNQNLALALYSTLAMIGLACIFYWRVFPDCYVEGAGITTFEQIGLMISCSAYLGALVLLMRNRREFDAHVYHVTAATLVVFFAQDAVSAMAVRMDDFARIVAHLCQVVALCFVYKAFVEVGLRRPYDLLFRGLQRSTEEIRQFNEILEQRATQLRALASELTLTEQRERRRLAQVLHDNLQQILVAARMKVQRLQRRAGHDDVLVQMADEVDGLIDQCISESRSLTAELSPPVLYDGGLAAGLEWLARRVDEQNGLPVEVVADRLADPADMDLRVFLFQAVRELLFNIVKHARATQAHVSMALAGGGELQIEVRDDGRGCDPGRLTSCLGDGGGFGLFNVRERLELLGGRFEIDTAPGKGVCVRIVVPPRELAATDDMAGVQVGTAWSPHGAPVPGVVSKSGGGLRVLLADDHPVLRKGLADLLREQAGIEVVVEARDGQEAVDLALEARLDVVVMDITMPRMDGIEATRQIKAHLPQVRVIGLSMHEDVEMARQMCDAGAVDYLRKDASTDALIAAVLHKPILAETPHGL